MQRHKMIILLILSGSIAFVAGCDERVAQVAREAADRQAEQNRTMAELHEEVAAGTKALVEADSQARRELLAAERELHAERSRLDEGRDVLERERKQLATERRTDSLLVPVLQSMGAIALAIVVVGFAWYALVRLRSDEVVDAELVELLVQEVLDERLPRLTADSKQLFPRPSPADRLTHEPSDHPD